MKIAKRILLVTHVPFWRHQNGSAARIRTLVSVLQRANHQVGLFFVGLLTQEDTNYLSSIGIYHHASVPDGTMLTYRDFLSFSTRLWACLPRYFVKLFYRARKQSFPFEKFRQERIAKCFNKFLAEFGPAGVLVEYIRFSFLLDSSKDGRVWIIDTHDVMHQRFDRFRALGLVHWVNVSREQERAALEQFDAILAIQQDDAKQFLALLGGGRVFVVPHGIRLEPVAAKDAGEPCIGYLGADNVVNRDALFWFLEKVWPHCRHFLPSLQFRLGGSICRSLDVRSDSGIKVIGPVDDLRDFYATVNLVVNPVRSGGGLKIKNVEALAFGLPLITTPVGAEGFPAPDQWPFIVATSEEVWCSEIMRLLQDKEFRDSLRDRGFDYVERHFSPGATYKPLLEYLAQSVK